MIKNVRLAQSNTKTATTFGNTKFKDNLIEYKYLSAYLGLAILETGENSNVWGLVWLCKTKYSEKLKLCIQTV